MSRKQKKRVLRTKRREWYQRWLRRQEQERQSRPIFEALEPKLLLSGATYYADDFQIYDDVNSSGTLDAGDIVTLDEFGGGTAVFGTDAFDVIQDAVNAASVDDIIQVGDGTFVGNVTIDKDLTLLSQNGYTSTTIQGVSGLGNLGTVTVTNATTGVQIGDGGQGFTIIGIDNGAPGVENAAVYFQGGHSGAVIRGNDIVANGDHGLLTEYGATIDNFVIDGNIFSGQTFVGANPAGDGFGAQFSLANVPRQLVAMGGGSGGGNTSNITFTNNQVVGTAGGTSLTDNAGAATTAHEQGNTLVTIDSAGAVITDNTFAGTTQRYGSSLRARGSNVVIVGNTFDASGQTATTNYMYLANGATANGISTDPTGLGEVVGANIFATNAVAVEGGNTVYIASGVQATIDASGPGVALRFAGTFTEDVDVNQALLVGGDLTLNGTLTLSVAGATLSAGYSPGIIASGNLTLTAGSILDAEVNGLTAGTEHDQYAVTGTVDLGGATLNASGTISASVGDSLVLIDNDGADAITGTFAGLVQGALLTINGDTFLIDYTGGDGNDVELIRVPATVSELYVDDDWAGTAFGDDPDGAGPAGVYGYNAFATIQEAIDAADDGAVINVLAGTYNEALAISKSLDLIGDPGSALEGEGASAPTLDGTSLFGVFGATITGATSTVLIDGFTFANWFTGGVSVEDGHVALSDSTVDGPLVGVSVDGGSAMVDASILTNAGIFGVEIVNGGSAQVTGSQIINANTAGVSASAGSAAISESVISGNATGVLVGATGSATVFGSSLAGNTVRAISNSSATKVNASGNYWGTMTQAGVAAQTLGLVDFSPFLVSSADTDVLAAGFQGDFSTIHVTTLGSQSGTDGRLQEAVDMVDASGTVHVLNGQYNESNTTISQSLTLEGESRSGVIIAPKAVDDHANGGFAGTYQQGLIVAADDVTIQTLTIDGEANVALSPNDHNFRMGITTADGGSFDNLHIDDVTIQNIYRRGIYIGSTTSTGHVVENSLITDVTRNDGIISIGEAQFLYNTISNVNGDNATASAAAIRGYSEATFIGNDISNALWGIVGDTSATILDNTIDDVSVGIVMNNLFYDGTNAGASLVTIQGNQITNIRDTGYVMYGIGMSLVNLADGSMIGGPNPGDENIIDISSGSDVIGMNVWWNPGEVTIQNNQLTVGDQNTGILVQYTPDLSKVTQIVGNTIQGTGRAGTGILLTEGEDHGNAVAVISDNDINDLETGIELALTSSDRQISATLSNNAITNNDLGLKLSEYDADTNGYDVTIASLDDLSGLTGNDVGILVDGGSLSLTGVVLSGNDIGLQVDGNGEATLTGGSISATTAGAQILGSGLTLDGVTISGAATGIDQTAGNLTLLNSFVNSNTIGLSVDNANALVEGTDLAGNSVGIRVSSDAQVDAGGGGNTGLGTSAGGNTLTGYSGLAGNYAIENLNEDAAGNVDVYAQGNDFGSNLSVLIENVVYHTVDDAQYTEVLFSQAPVLTAPTIVYVDDDWAGTALGVDADGAGGSHGDGTGYGYDQFATISDAIAAVVNGGSGEVKIYDGTYGEQLLIDFGLVVTGESELGTVIQAPPVLTLDNSFVYSGQTKQSVVAVTGGTVTIQTLTVDGNGGGNAVVSGNDFDGIGILNADVTIDNVTVTGVRDSVLAGTQRGRAIFAGVDDGGPYTVSVTDSTIENYQKNGIDLRGVGLTVDISGNMINGSGDVTVIAQNGIVMLGGATGTISGNTISDHMYSGTTGGPDLFNDWQSIGILLYDAGSGVVIDGNTIDANDVGIYSWGGTVQVSNNILGSSVVNRYEGILVDQSTSDLTGNDITGGNIGIAIVAFSGSGGNSEATLAGNTISSADVGVQVVDDDATVDPVLTVGAGNTISGGTTGLQVDGAGAQITGLTLNDLTFAGQSGDYVTLLNGALDNLVVDASAVTVDGTIGASLTPAQLAAAEAKITDQLDDGTLGRIQLQGGLIVVTPTLSPTAADNDYIRIKNAIEAATAGDTIMLLPNGTDSVFNWDEVNALASWELGNDGVASTDDDFGILLGDGQNDVTVTANTADNISIQGPGDITSFDLEGVFLAFDNGTNTGWTFENFGILDFDNAIGFYYSGDDYSDLTINNMHIRVAADDATDSFQNIGIHYARGTNITITNNLFELDGSGDGTTFAIQSNTHGGTNYDGLNISGNQIVVMNGGGENIYGIWENGHAHQSNITVSGNSFSGNAGNTGTQVAFRVTSHSGASSTVSYDNNTVAQADVAFDWLDVYYGSPIDYTGTLPVEMNGNIVTNSGVAYDIGGIMGSANITGGSITGASGIGVQIADGNSAMVSGVTLQNLDTGILVGGSATIIGNSFDNANDNLVDIQLASTATAITIGAGNTFGGDDYYIENLSGLGMNLVGLGSIYDEVDNFRIEDKMYHAADDAASGLIRVVAGNLYVTTPGTGLSNELIQNAVNVAAVGDTVNVEAGTFNEDLLISTEGVKVIGQGQGVTIIDHTGQPGNNNAGVYLTADDTELRSLSVTGNNASSTPRYGVKVADVDGVVLDGVTISDSYRTGLDILGASNITLNNLVSENNGGAGIFMTDVNGASLSNITTSNNPWIGISIATWGRYTPLGTSGIVFSGTNSFGETATDNGGLQLEMGNYNDPLNPELISWSSNPADNADVTFLSADFGYALSGPTSDNDNLYTRFYQTLVEAEAAAAGSPDHIAANDRYIQEADDSNGLPNSGPTQLYVFDNAGNTMSIQAAVDAAVGGDTINVAAGTFEGTVDANKSVTIDGQGLSSIIDAGGVASHGVLVHADDLVLSNLRITNANDAVRFDTAVDGVQLLHVQADNAGRGVSVQSSLTDLMFDDVTLTGNGTGMRVATLGAIVGFDLLNSAFDGNDYGMTVYASGSLTNNEANFTDILIQNTSFSNNLEKGFYAEKLDNATLDNVTVDSSGTGGAATYDSGIDINLKYGTYTNIDILGGAITNSGTGDAVNGTGLTIKARGTGNDPSYASNPATLTDVVIDGTTISGNQVGIRIGEPGKANTGPSGVLIDADVSDNVDVGIAIVGGQVTVQNTDLTGNQVGVLVDGGATADLGGGSLASVGNNDLTGYSGVGGNYAIEDLNLAAQPDVYADNNSFGSTVAGVIESIVFDDTDDATRSMVIATNPQGAGVTSPIYVDDDWAGTVVGVDPDGVGGVSAIYGIDAFANINDALDAVSAGGEIIVFAGTYNERFDLDQSVNLHSDAYAGTSTSGRTAGDASEAIIDLQGQEGTIGEGIRITSSDVTFAGFEIVGGSATNYGIYISGGGNNLDNIAIENNFIHGMALPNPVVSGSELTYGILGDSNGVSTWGELSNLSIVGNEIYDLGSAGTASGYGINLYDVNGATITGNALHDLADGLNDVGTGVSVTFAGSGANPLAGVSSNVTIANDSYANMSVGVRLLADSGSSVTQDVADFSNVELYVMNAGDLPRASVNLTGQHVWTNNLAVSAAIQGYLAAAGITEPTAGYTGSIQTAIDQSNEDATVTLTAGTFAENVTVDKDINLVGQGSSTLWTPSGSGNIVTIAGSGFGDDQTVTIQDIDFDGQSGTANAGVYVGSAADFANLSITNGDFTGFNYYAIAVFGDAGTGISVQDVDLTNLTFSNNGIAGSGGTADIQFYEYNGDATLTGLVHVGNRNEGAGSGARSAIQFRGVGAGDGTGVLAGGNIVLDDIEVTGTYRNQFIGIQRYTDVSNFSFNDVVLGGGASDLVGGWGAVLRFDAVGDLASKGTATPASVDLGNTYFRGIVSSISGLVSDIEFAPDNNFAWLRADGTDTQWDTTTGTQVAASSLTLDELFEVEDRILHYVEPDHPSHLNSFHGFVEVVDGTAYITETFSSLINRGIEVVDEGGTVFIDAGTYIEDVNVNRYVNLDGAGSGSNPAVDTVISPVSSTYGLQISASGLDASNRLTVQDLHVTGSASHGVVAYGQDHIEILNVESSGNDLDGFHLSDMDDLVITDSTASNNGAVNPPTVGHGFDLNGVRDAVLTNLTAVDNYSAGIGISARASTTGASSNIDIIGGTFSDGSSTRPEGSNGISLYVDDAHGASSISDVTIGGTISISDFLFGGITLFNAGVTSSIDNIQIGQTVGDSVTLSNNVIGLMMFGNVTNVDADADFVRGAASTAGVSALGLDETGTLSPDMISVAGSTFTGFDNTAAAISLAAVNPSPAPAYFVSANTIDVTGATFDGVDPGTLSTGDPAFWTIEDQIVHAIDVDGAALIDFDPAGNHYLTTSSFVSGINTNAMVQRAVDVATAGDTIYIQDGTYVEGSQVVIDKNLTIDGQSRVGTILTPGYDTSTSGNARGWWLVNAGIDLDVSSLTYDGTGNSVWQAVRHLGTGSFDDVAFSTIQYSASGSPYAGTAIAAFGGVGAVDVTNSYFDTIGRIGVQYFGAGTTGTFSGNTYTGKGVGDFLDYAVEVSAGAIANINNNIITDNLGVAASDGSTSAGVLVTTYFAPGTEAHLSGNVISNSTSGVAAGYDGTDTSIVTLTGDTLDGNEYGVSINGASVSINAGTTIQNGTTGVDVDSNGSVTIDGATISGNAIGVDVGSTGSASITNSDITGTAGSTGVLVSAGGSASIVNNPTTITGHEVGIDVDGGTALIENNDLNGNMIGVLIQNGGVADLGDNTGSDITGLGTGSGANGSSAGLNDFGGYTTTATASNGAIVNLNNDGGLVGTQGLPPDVPAFGNTWDDASPSGIENVVYHDSDDNNLGFVDFADLLSLSVSLDVATIGEGSSVQLLGTFSNSPQDHTLTVNWGDGNTDIIAVPAGVFDLSTLSITHTYDDNGPVPSGSPYVYAISVTLEEDAGPGVLTDNSLTATVNNVAPTVALSGAATTDEADVYTLSIGAVTDPGDDTVIQYRVIWGDGNFDVYTSAQIALMSGLVSHTYQDGPGGVSQISVELTDEDGIHANAGILPLSVNNLDPYGTFDNGGPVDAGSPGFVTWYAQGDPSPVDASSLVYDYDFGDDGTFEIIGSSMNFATVPGLYLTTPGTYDVRGRIRDKDGGSYEEVTTITVNATTFRVLNFTTNASGFEAVFSGDLDMGVFNLYDSYDAPVELADLYVVDTNGEVAGSAIFDPSSNKLTWVKTGGVLEAGNYTVFMVSGPNAMKEAGSGALLDGNSDGTPGDNYVMNFTVTANTDRVLSLPDFARGPGQTVDVPATGLGLPVTLDDATGVNAVDFDVIFDATLLNITGVSLGASLPGDWTVTYNLVSPGHLKVTTSGITTLSGSDVQIVTLTANVPSSAEFGGAQVIRLESVAVNGGFINSVGDRALHKAAYLGDVDGDFFFSGLDASLISGVVVDLVTGFDAFDKTDPVILANSTGTGTLNGLDASYVAQKSVALPRPEIPDLPAVAPAGVPGEDPVLTVSSGVVANIGTTVSVPISIDDADGLLGFNIDLAYDTDVLDITNGDVSLGSLLSGAGGWNVVANVDDVAGTIKLAFYRADGPMPAGGGEVAILDFTVLSGAASIGTTNVTADGPTDLGGKTYNYIAGSIDVQPISGDLNSDGFVGLDDLDIVLGNWNQYVTAGDWLSGDPSGDGYVGLTDLDIVLNNWNAGTPPVAQAVSVSEEEEIASNSSQQSESQSQTQMQTQSQAATGQSQQQQQQTQQQTQTRKPAQQTQQQQQQRQTQQQQKQTPQQTTTLAGWQQAPARSAFGQSDEELEPTLGLWESEVA